MTQGFLYGPDTGTRMKWMDGEPTWKALFGIGRKASDLTAQRCVACGFVEFYADTASKPVDTVASLVAENEQLRLLVSKLNNRLATLEEIVVDPAERTAREIERLRISPGTEAGEQ
jgi:hypothetical protein